MILYFDTYITDVPLVPSFVEPNKAIRKIETIWEMPKKIDIFKYSLISYTQIKWDHVVIRYIIDDIFLYAELDAFILGLFPRAIIHHERCTTQGDHRKVIEFLKKFNDDWVFYVPNNDHPFVSSDINIFYKCLEKAKEFSDKHDFVSIMYSHWSEFINLPYRFNPFNDKYGADVKRLYEDDDMVVIKKGKGDFSSIQLLNMKLLEKWYCSVDVENLLVRRPEDIRTKVLVNNHIIILPKKELCAHFDGYSHSIGSYTEILPQRIPPLFIPPGFFERNIKIRYGYDRAIAGYLNISPFLKKYTFDYPHSGTDMISTLSILPTFWKDRIASIDVNENLVEKYDGLYDKRNPWEKYGFVKKIKKIIRRIRIKIKALRIKLG